MNWGRQIRRHQVRRDNRRIATLLRILRILRIGNAHSMLLLNHRIDYIHIGRKNVVQVLRCTQHRERRIVDDLRRFPFLCQIGNRRAQICLVRAATITLIMAVHGVERVHGSTHHNIVLVVHIRLIQARLLNHLLTEASHLHRATRNDAVRDNDILFLRLLHDALHHTTTFPAEVMAESVNPLLGDGNGGLGWVVHDAKRDRLLCRQLLLHALHSIPDLIHLRRGVLIDIHTLLTHELNHPLINRGSEILSSHIAKTIRN